MTLNIFQYQQESEMYGSFSNIGGNDHPIFTLFDHLQGPLQDVGRNLANLTLEGYDNVVLL